MNQETILVTYATRSGSTEGVADAIAKTLAESGLQVVVKPVSEVTDVTPYRAVVVGSAIQGQKWLPEAMQFVQKHRDALAKKPFAIFLVCVTLSMKGGDQYRDGLSSWLAPVRALVRPVSEGLFAGTLDFGKMPLNFNTLMMRIPVLLRIWRVGDHRDWDAVRLWAERTRPLLVK